MLCVTPSPLNLDGLVIHIVAIQICLHSGKELIVGLGQIQVVKGPVFKHLVVLICQVESEVKLLVISAEDRGGYDVQYIGCLLLKVINIGKFFFFKKPRVLTDAET